MINLKNFMDENLLSNQTSIDLYHNYGKDMPIIDYTTGDASDLITKSNGKVICTTDDPIDTLEYHIKLKEDENFDVKVLLIFILDKGIEIN